MTYLFEKGVHTTEKNIWKLNEFKLNFTIQIEPTVVIDFICLNFADVQFIDIMKIMGGATTLDSFLKAYKAKETKNIFPRRMVWQSR